MFLGGISRSQRIINGRTANIEEGNLITTDPYEGSPPRLLPCSDKD